MPLVLCLLLGAVTASAAEGDQTIADRPTMRAFGGADGPPSRRELVDARQKFKLRFREPLAHTQTAAGALLAAETLFNASVDEQDRSLKWLMLDEARRLGQAAGEAEAVSRAITLASAVYEFDALDAELRSLSDIPLRGIDAGRAVRLAQVAEQLADRAETDERLVLAASSLSLAVRGWQRAGDLSRARRAHDRLRQIESGLQPR